MRLYPYKITLACAVPLKGVNTDVINMIVRVLRDMGLVRFAYRCDREKALNAMVEQACIQSGRMGSHADSEEVPGTYYFPIAPIEDDESDAPTAVAPIPKDLSTTVATPELTHPGESNSNTLAERRVRTLDKNRQGRCSMRCKLT